MVLGRLKGKPARTVLRSEEAHFGSAYLSENKSVFCYGINQDQTRKVPAD